MSDSGVRGPLPLPPPPRDGEGDRGGGCGSETAGADGRGSETAGAGHASRGAQGAGAGDNGRDRAHAARPHDAAREYTRRGWRVVPLPPRAKGPVMAGWQALRLGEDDLPRWFDLAGGEGGANVGLLLGAASGGLVDVDCDAPEAVRAAALLLPPTGRVSGRASHPRSHYWYVVAEDGEPPRTTKFAWEERHGLKAAGNPMRDADAAGKGCSAVGGDLGLKAAANPVRDTPAPGEPVGSPAAPEEGTGPPTAAMLAPGLPAGLQPAAFSPAARASEPGSPAGAAHAHTHTHASAMLVELRSTGCQTVAPPSVHPSGERVRWEAGGEGEPGRVAGADLRRAVARVAACALLARHWPSQGTRDEAALALCGMLVRGGWPAGEADDFTRAVAQVAGDEEWAKRGKAAQSARALAAGEPVMGGPALAQRLAGGDGERVVAKAREWVGLGEPSDASKVLKGAKDAHYRDVSIFGVDEQLCSVVLSDVAPRPLRWLWEGRIPLGKIALLDGDPGLGKSMLTLDLIARVTTGRDMPDGSPGVDGGAVLLSAEDDLATTIRPRLQAAHADVMRVVAPQTVRTWDLETGRERERAFTLPADIEHLESAIAQVGARLVVIDPLMAYLDGKVNSWRDQDVRAALAPLARLAERTGAAVFILRHLNKASGGNVLYRGGGSIGIIGAARSGLLVAAHPDEPERDRVLASNKSNLGPPMPSLRYRIARAEGAVAPHIEWLGECEHTASSLLAGGEASGEGRIQAAPTRVDEAEAWLRERLAAGPQPSVEVQRQARAYGFGDVTLRRARERLGVRVRHEGFSTNSYWVWELPDSALGEGAPNLLTLPKVAHDLDMSNFGGDEQLCARLPSPPAPAAPGDACPSTGGAHGEGMAE